VLFCVICIFLLRLIEVPLPPGKPPFVVQLNNNNNHNTNNKLSRNRQWRPIGL
jgi:hypothetical protein